MRKEFNNLDFGPIIPMGECEFGKAPAFPKAGEHPRLMLTKDMIPAVKQAFEDERLAPYAAELKERSEKEFDGILGIPYYHETGRKGIHNSNEPGLGIIAAKAFMYALYGDKELAYQAIDAMQNYLLTLNIRFIFCDQCRDFGRVMYTVARVYDWCYDVLTEDEKYRLVAGTINYVVAGDCGMLQSDEKLFHNYGGTKKMEIGYPPRLQSGFTGHGAEAQLTKDYMSAAIAFYDEHPDWWEFCAGRYFNEFIPARNAVYASGSVPQGILYGASRQSSDLWAAFAHTVLFGKNPHDDTMLDTVRSNWNLELPNESFWSDGDAGKDLREVASGTLSHNSLIAAAIYRDAGLLAQRLRKYPSIISDSSPEAFLYAGKVIDLVPPENRHEGYPTVYHVPLYLNRMLARREWDDPNSPAVFMKGGERSTSNHEHKDMGTFQIFYKDLLARDEGTYDVYGSPFSTGTVAHNGVLVYNPEKADTLKGFYSGGQCPVAGATTLEYWLTSDKFRTAIPEGASYATREDGKADYAYLASNIAPAYDEDVDYLSRRMLAIFPESKEFPLIFACYDRIMAASGSFKKSILLHADNEPEIDGACVTLKNGGGKLVATYLSDRDFAIETIGGEGNNRVINGKQCPLSDFRGGGWHSPWGRIEVVPEAGSKTDDMLAVMYVTDEENENKLKVEKLSGLGMIGATVMNNALLFVKMLAYPGRSYEIEVAGEGDMTYYVSGLSAGKWRVKAGKKSLTVTVKEEERFARFTAPCGKLTLTQV